MKDVNEIAATIIKSTSENQQEKIYYNIHCIMYKFTYNILTLTIH